MIQQAIDSLAVALTLLTGQVDAARIVAHSDTVRAQSGIYFPNSAALAVAWQETRSGRSGNSARGPGIIDSTGRRVCREIGRFQLRPCDNYRRLDARCTGVAIRSSYDVNVHCGLMLFVDKLRRCSGDVLCAITRYIGAGRDAAEYRQKALAYIGHLSLLTGDLDLKGTYGVYNARDTTKVAAGKCR